MSNITVSAQAILNTLGMSLDDLWINEVAGKDTFISRAYTAVGLELANVESLDRAIDREVRNLQRAVQRELDSLTAGHVIDATWTQQHADKLTSLTADLATKMAHCKTIVSIIKVMK